MAIFVTPYPRKSNGLLDGATDLIGGDPLQEPVMIDLWSDASGHIIIGPENGGGIVTWIRGVWNYGTEFRYDDFMAGTTDPNATNYASSDSAATAENKFVGGTYSTLLIPDGTLPNTRYHVRYSRRSGKILEKGSAINGWPYNYVDPDYYGTAVDGDMYVMWALATGYAAFKDRKYQSLFDRIANANLDAGRPQGNLFTFSLPLSAEAGAVGLYEYYAENASTLFSTAIKPRGDIPGRCLEVTATVPSGGPPYNYAGIGCWQTWAVSPANEPFVSFKLEFDGGKCNRNIEFSTAAQEDVAASEVNCLIPCLPSKAGVFTEFEFLPSDLWRLHNVVMEYKHKEPQWLNTAGTSTATFIGFEEADDALVNCITYNTVVSIVGNNLVQNGEFTVPLQDPPWRDSSGGDGTVTIVNSQAVLHHSASPRARLRQGLTVEANVVYQIQFTCSNFVGPDFFLDIGTTAGSGDIDSNIVCDNGINTIYASSPTTSMWLNFFSQSADINYTLDNVRAYKTVNGGTAGVRAGIDTSVVNSALYTYLRMELMSNVTAQVIVDIGGTNQIPIVLYANVKQVYSAPISSFGVVVHPIDQIEFMFASETSGRFYMYGIWFDDIVTMADIPGGITAIDGFEFQFPSYDAGEPYNCRFDNILLNVDIVDGPVSDPERYVGIPRWTYKWTAEDDWVGYGMWRGWTGCGYLWLGGWTKSGIVNPDNGRSLIQMQRDFLSDAQAEYVNQFGGHIGPFMPRYGRASWEALNQEGVVNKVFTDNTYNKWYFPWDDSLGTGPGADQSDDWYGYTCRAILSCASDYYIEQTAQVKQILDNWIDWFNLGEDTLTRAVTKTNGFWAYTDTSAPVVGIVWDEDHWHPPSAYIADGRVRYHYNPTYSYACIIQAMMYKYWADGDPDALKWMNRLLAYFNNQQLRADGVTSIEIRKADDSGTRYVTVGVGSLVVVQRGDEGEGYTTASVVIEGDGEGAQVVPRIFAGRIRYYEILNVGLDYTWIKGTVVGDGKGATVCFALYDQLCGAFSIDHTGWDVFEIYNTYSLLLLGKDPLGTVNYPIPTPEGVADIVAGLEQFFATNTRNEYPMMFLSNYLPMHEYGGWDPYHYKSGIENPMIRDSRTRGKTWTETSGPCHRAGIFYHLIHGYCPWLDALFMFHAQLSGSSEAVDNWQKVCDSSDFWVPVIDTQSALLGCK